MNAQEPADPPVKPIRNIVILGGGSAGFLTALALKKQLPGIELVMVRSTKMGVIGVSEGTIISVVPFLHQYLDLPSRPLHEKVRPAIKPGLWDKRPFFHYTFSRQPGGNRETDKSKRGINTNPKSINKRDAV